MIVFWGSVLGSLVTCKLLKIGNKLSLITKFLLSKYFMQWNQCVTQKARLSGSSFDSLGH